jgi:hypothetical protein
MGLVPIFCIKVSDLQPYYAEPFIDYTFLIYSFDGIPILEPPRNEW